MMSLVCLKKTHDCLFPISSFRASWPLSLSELPWYQVSSCLAFADLFASNSLLITISHRIKHLCFLAQFSLKSQEIQSQALPMKLKTDYQRAPYNCKVAVKWLLHADGISVSCFAVVPLVVLDFLTANRSSYFYCHTIPKIKLLWIQLPVPLKNDCDEF